MSESSVIKRDYIDNFLVKEFAVNNLVPAYFPDVDVSLRTVGTIGYITELITNYGEDTFNTGSVLFRESFPNRAQMPESIYSHAGIFQLSDVFSSAARCRFLLVMEEDAILKNMLNDYDKDSGIYHFYIDKNTIIYVEDIPFTLDYDIRMNIVKKVTEKGDSYIFTASYVFDEFTNSISDLKDPYVKIRRSTSGYIAIEVIGHQCTRDVRYEQIITNSDINYPVIDLKFNGKLAGFDVLYKSPTSTNYKQIEKKIVFSPATKKEFCYYQIVDKDTLRITFNTRSNYFTPEFNSELQVILYLTNGTKGNFEVYNGNNIALEPNNEKYSYANTYLTAAKPVGSSDGGKDQMELEALQALTVEGFRTANAITTEDDLLEYFSNYSYRYGDTNIMFIKKRDDLYERLYSGFIIIRNNDYIYKTNTLNLKLNLADMRNPETNVYLIEPGCVFTCNEANGYADFLLDQELEDKYYLEYLDAIKNGEINYIEDTDQSHVPAYLRRPASFSEFKKRKGYDDKYNIFNLSDVQINELDNPGESKFLIVNPFLIRFTKYPNLISTYMTYISNSSLVDFTGQNNSSYVQFIIYTLTVERGFTKDKKYTIQTSIASSIPIDSSYPIIKTKQVTVTDEYGEESTKLEYILNDKYSVVDNDLRVFMMIEDDSNSLCFTELYPTSYDPITENIIFTGEMFTDDHITSEGKLRILTGTIYRNPEDGSYYKVHDDDNTLYNKFDKDDNVIETDVYVDYVTELKNDGTVVEYNNVVNTLTTNDINIPMSDVKCKIFTLYKRAYNSVTGDLDLVKRNPLNNVFTKYDETLSDYIWTNEYATLSEPVTFMKPLNSVRSFLTFEDFTEVISGNGDESKFSHDIMDCVIHSIPFIRAKIAKNEESMDYFMSTFFANYNFLNDIIQTKLRNSTGIDVKFYNTYGRSKNFTVGEGTEVLNTINLSISFDIYFVNGTELLIAVQEVKQFIKSQIESINSKGLNNLFISNLMKKIENNFAYVDHIKFNNINSYDSNYQTVKTHVTDLNDLTVEERRFYVPELLTCDIDDIHITEYYVS